MLVTRARDVRAGRARQAQAARVRSLRPAARRQRPAARRQPVPGALMPRPPDYERLQPLQFGGALPEVPSYDAAAAVILPAPLDRTTSYVPGTRNGPRELLLARPRRSSCGTRKSASTCTGAASFTLPEMDLTSGTMETALAEHRPRRRRASSTTASSWSRSAASTRSRRRSWPRRRGATAGSPCSRSTRTRICGTATSRSATATLRDAPHARVRAGRAGRHPQHLGGRGRRAAVAQDDDLLRLEHARRSGLDRRASSTRSSDTVYITIDLDGLDPATDAGGGHAGAGRPVVAGADDAAAPHLRAAHASSRATSSSCVRFLEWRRRTSSRRGWSTSC